MSLLACGSAHALPPVRIRRMLHQRRRWRRI